MVRAWWKRNAVKGNIVALKVGCVPHSFPLTSCVTQKWLNAKSPSQLLYRSLLMASSSTATASALTSLSTMSNPNVVCKGKITHRSWSQLPPEVIRFVRRRHSLSYRTERHHHILQVNYNSLSLGFLLEAVFPKNMGYSRKMASTASLYHFSWCCWGREINVCMSRVGPRKWAHNLQSLLVLLIVFAQMRNTCFGNKRVWLSIPQPVCPTSGSSKSNLQPALPRLS